MNKVILIGRLTKDPELKKVNGDVSVVSFALAVNRNYQSRNGEREVDFINCVAWRNQAENLAKYIRKGAQIAIEGNLQTRKITDNNGVTRTLTDVVCDQIHFIEPRRRDTGYDDLSQLEIPPVREEKNQNIPQENPFADLVTNNDISDDDLPF